MLLISVIVIAVTAAAYYFVPTFQGGVLALARDTSSILATGQIGGIGMARSGSSGAGPGSGTFRPNGPGVGNIPMSQPPGGFAAPGTNSGSGNTGYSGPLGPANSPPMPGTVAFDRAPRTGVQPMSIGPAVGAGPSTPVNQ
jgi:hypothetical protein